MGMIPPSTASIKCKIVFILFLFYYLPFYYYHHPSPDGTSMAVGPAAGEEEDGERTMERHLSEI